MPRGTLLGGRDVDDFLEIDLVKAMISMKQVYTAIFRPFGIETPEWHALLRLAEADGPSQSELGERLLRDKVAITRLIAGLERKGLVARKADRDDARKQRVLLTAAARRLIPQALAERDRLTERVAAGLSENEKTTLRRLLRKLQRGLDEARLDTPTKQRKGRTG